MSHLRLPFAALLVLAFTRVLGAAESISGSWYRDEVGQDHAIRTVITFGEKGIFSTEFIQVPNKHGMPSIPLSKIEGRWEYEKEIIVLHLPSTAPVGVVPKEETKVRWRVVSVTKNELSLCDESGSDRRDWRKTEANKALVPTPMSVTIPAAQEVAPATGAAHL